MGTAPERSRPLHNFTLPRLKWGNQRFLRCIKLNNPNGHARRSSPSEAESDSSNRSRASTELINHKSSETFKRSPSSPLNPIRGGGGGESNKIEAVHQKLMFDLRATADRMKVPILEDKELEESNSAARPWNLRTRRYGGGTGAKSPMATAKSSRLRGLAAAAAMTTQQSVEKRENGPRAKFSNSLSREEVERDFLAMAGMRPPRRPKKRPKIVQKQVDAIFPGLWLMEITPDTYKVPDLPEPGKA